MSLATRCTACGTIFRVVQDQLRVSEGWVRCGRCAEVFDAREQLFDIDREAPPPWPAAAAPAAPVFEDEPALTPPPAQPAPPPPVPDTTWNQPTETFTPAAPLPPPPPPPPAVPAPPPPIAAPAVAQRASVPDDAFESSRFEAPFDSRFDSRLEPRWSDEDTMIAPATVADEPMFATSLGSTSAAALPDSEMATLPDVVLSAQLAGGGAATAGATPSATTTAAMPSFMRAAERAERWRRPGVRLALGAGAVALTALLALQATLHFHDALAAIHPPLRPMLASLCGMTGCEIKPWRRISGLSVENSALTLAGGTGQYLLSVSLRNETGVELATPWIELTLTDAAGLTIARRMVAPSEFKGSKPSMPPTSELPLQLVMSTSDQKVVGYYIEIFHP